MVIAIDVELRGVESLKKSQLNRAMKRANKIIGKLFRKKFLPGRFEAKTGRKLGFRKRSGEIRIGLVKKDRKSRALYGPQKWKKKHHADPLVFSGDGERRALSDNLVFSTRDKIRIPLPRKYNWRNPKSKVNMSKEIRTVLDSEAVTMSRFLVKQIERELAREAGSIDLRGRVESASISNL